LSKFASARGLRDRLSFKIGYDADPSDVKEMLTAAHERAVEDSSISIVDGHNVEIRVIDTGDYAVEWGLFYYTKDIKGLVRTRQLVREIVLEESLSRNISLSTPDLYQNAVDPDQALASHPFSKVEPERAKQRKRKQQGEELRRDKAENKHDQKNQPQSGKP